MTAHQFFDVMWDWYVNVFAAVLLLGTLATTVKWIYKYIKDGDK